MGKWIFCCDFGNNKKVYRCSECASTITVDSELIDKMDGEKFCYNCGERMNGEPNEKEQLQKDFDALRKQYSELYAKMCNDVVEEAKIIKKDRTRIIDLTVILDHYGRKAQRRQAVEELSELIQAICKYERINYTFGECEDDPKKAEETITAYKNLLGEIADVIVMIEQLKIMVGERDRTKIENIIDEKINRQLERIKAESEGLQ